MGMRMEYNESHLKLLKDTFGQYDEGLVEEAYERLIFEKYDFKDMEALRKEIVRQLNKVLNQREIDRDQFLMKKALLEKKFIKPGMNTTRIKVEKLNTELQQRLRWL